MASNVKSLSSWSLKYVSSTQILIKIDSNRQEKVMHEKFNSNTHESMR